MDMAPGTEAQVSPQNQREPSDSGILESLFKMEAASDQDLIVTHQTCSPLTPDCN